MRFYDVPVNQSVLTETNRGLTSYTAAFSFLVSAFQALAYQLLVV
jgi:hypothetical protein